MTSTDTIIKTAATRDGWEIGILERHDRRTGGIASYGIIRINPRGKYVILYNCFSIPEAREAANLEWARDRGVA